MRPFDFKYVPVLYTSDYNGGATFDSINMKNYHSCTFIIEFGAITGDAVLTINSGATDAATTSALTFKYKYGSAARGSATCDVMSTPATSAALTLTGTTFANRLLIVTVEASEMDLASDEEWLTGSISDAASAGIAMVTAILEPRYTNDATALT